MYYCFTDDLFRNTDGSDDAYLQFSYAKKLNRVLCMNLNTGKILTVSGKESDVRQERILLRTTSDHVEPAIQCICKNGGRLIEDNHAVYKLKHWFEYAPPKRFICSFASYNKLKEYVDSGMMPWIADSCVFLKTVRKKYSNIITGEDLLSDSFWKELFSRQTINNEEELIVSRVENIETDQFGKKEWRCVVRNGRVQNISRYFHSLVHKIPNQISEEAEKKAFLFSGNKDFPSDYVMDLMNTTDKRIEIVELNPLSSSMCYVNNSIFTEKLDEIADVHASLGIGYEFCLDWLTNPTRYHLSPEQGITYTYFNG